MAFFADKIVRMILKTVVSAFKKAIEKSSSPAPTNALLMIGTLPEQMEIIGMLLFGPVRRSASELFELHTRRLYNVSSQNVTECRRIRYNTLNVTCFDYTII
jgi:hypothetical protein